MELKYSDFKKAILALRKYGYTRVRTKGHRLYVKYWTRQFSTYAISLDVFELAMTNEFMNSFLDRMELKALHMLEESEK